APDFPARPPHQRALMRFATARATANVFVSGLEREAVPRLVPVTRPSMVPHTIDERVYRPGTGRDPSLLLSFVLMDGGNSVRKCTASSIRAFARLARDRPDLRFVIAGKKGSDYPGLQALADG